MGVRISACIERSGRPKPLRTTAVLAAGASVGFTVWRLTVSRTTFHSFVFFNNLAATERRSLLLFLASGALLMLAVWLLLTQGLARTDRPKPALARTGSWLSAGLLAAFLPFLAVPAMEVFHTWLMFALVAGFVGVAFLVARDVSRHGRASPAIRSPDGGSAGRVPVILLILFSAGYAAFFIAHTLSRHSAFHSYALDLGWQHQAIHTLLATGNPVVTLWSFTLNHFGNHFQPLYYLLAPIYALHQDATTLLVLQAVMLASAAVPLYLIAERRLRDPWIALLLAAVYLLYPPLHSMNNYDFHGLVLLVPFTFWMLYALEIRSAPLFWVFFALGLITREDTAVSLSGLGLYLLLDRDRRKLGLAVLGICAAWFVVVLVSMSALDGYADLSNYWALTVPEHQSFAGVLLTLVTNPVFVLMIDQSILTLRLHRSGCMANA